MDPRKLLDYLALLLNYVARRLRYYEAIGDLQPDELAPEEIVDAIYLEAGEELRHGPPGEHGYRWMRALADRLLERERRRIRAARKRAGAPEVPLARRLPELLPDPTTPLPEAVADAAELQRALACIVGELPAHLREPLLLLVVDGYDVDDVAALERLSPGEVTWRVARARRLLRDRLAREYGDREAPPLEKMFRLVERLQPSATAAARARGQLGATPAPPPTTAA